MASYRMDLKLAARTYEKAFALGLSISRAGRRASKCRRSGTTTARARARTHSSLRTIWLDGFHIGGNAGVAWSPKGEFSDSLGNFFDGASQSTVFTGGGQVGANYQINYWLVVGVEADFNWLSDHNNKSNGVFIPTVGNVQVAADSRWITTLAARVGDVRNVASRPAE